MRAATPLRLPVLLLASLLAALTFAVAHAPAAALAQSTSGGVEPWEDTSGGEDYWADDDAYQDSGEPWSGGQPDWDEGAGGSAAGTLPAPTPAPPTPAPGSAAEPAAPGWPGKAPKAPATPAPTPAPKPQQAPIVTGSIVAGRVARMRGDGKAAVPRGAPKRVRRLISALNEIVGKPYVWGGGHAKLYDRGYDCSGAVGYGLIRTGMLASPMVSGGMAKAFAAGAGKWVTIYANAGHVYMEVAGLRFDTSPIGDASRNSGVRWRPVIGRRAGFAVRHVAGL